MKQVSFFATIMLLALFFSCKKEDPVNNEYTSFDYPSGYLNYMDIPMHSYFIYKDSSTGNEDSVIVTENIKRTIFNYGNGVIAGNQYKHYVLQMDVTLSKFISANNSSLWLKARSVTNDNRATVATAESVMLFAGPCEDCMWGILDYPIVSNYDPFSDRGAEILNSYEVEGKVYNDVIHIVYGVGSPTDDEYKNVIYYWAKGVGIVKRTFTSKSSTQTWTLLRNG
ncbi:MAG: hypothetical protein ABUT20_08700 [Bacteroidota bacterium]